MAVRVIADSDGDPHIGIGSHRRVHLLHGRLVQQLAVKRQRCSH
jgi:hypothetical protein